MLMILGSFLATQVNAASINTSFDTTDGFITGDTAPVILSDGSFTATFSGGQQQQMFDGPSYNSGPAAYLFVNGGTGFTGTSGNTAASTGDATGQVDFNQGVSEISFFAANRANGAQGRINVFAEDDLTLLGTVPVTQTENTAASGAVATVISSADFAGQLIGSIAFDNAGPASPPNPPYVIAIDSFTATAAPTISTSFDLADGFATGGTAPVILNDGSFTATFSGGQQQQMFDGPSYNSGPAAYLFVNGGTGFTGTSGNTAASTGDAAGLIDFNQGVSEISFFAANRANGPEGTINIFAEDDVTLLGSVPVIQSENTEASGAIATVISSADFAGQLIGSIGFDNAGPADPPNSPYVIAIDSFTARAAAVVDAVADPIFSAVLPASRSVQVGVPATAFASIVNASANDAVGCTISTNPSISTSFNTTDGFITGDTAPVTLSDGSLTATFSGGQQQQMFDGPSYNSGPAGYLFVNGGTGFTGTSGNTAASTGDATGLIDFNQGVSEISFFAANRANGAQGTINVFAEDDVTLLGSVPVIQTENTEASGAVATVISSADFAGQLIGSIGFDNAGPASPVNPPYVIAIDSFTASVGTTVDAAFSFQTTDPATNELTGSPNTPVVIPAGETQSFLIALTPNSAFAPTNVPFIYDCANTDPAVSTIGVNSLLVSADDDPIPDVIALTTVIDLAASVDSTALFAVGSANVGATGDITVSLGDNEQGLPLNLSICQTDADGCIAPPTATSSLTYPADTTASFAVFAEATSSIANDPANNRIFITFTDSLGIVRGSTSTAVQTP